MGLCEMKTKEAFRKLKKSLAYIYTNPQTPKLQDDRTIQCRK